MSEVKEAKKETKKILTWQEKVKAGIPLSGLDQIKADAWRIQTRREQQAKEDAALEEERKDLAKSKVLTAADLDVEE